MPFTFSSSSGWRDTLSRYGADQGVLAAFEAAASSRGEPVLPGRIARAGNSPVTVLAPGATVRARLPGTGLRPVAGDWVLVDMTDPAASVVTGLLPRRTALVRHASGKQAQAQTLAANMDDVFVTVAADRDIPLAKVERFLALVWESGATPVLVLAKSDLLAPGDAGRLLATAAGIAPGAEACLVSAVTGEGMDQLQTRIGTGRTAALIGSSGAGKSSLLNALAGAGVAATSQVRGGDGKGRHTTAWRELVVLDSGGAIIDTPGLRGLGLWLDEGGLDAAFADVAELALGCRFADCGHDTEPGCAVTAAIEAGTLEARRLASYRKLEREAAHVARKHDPRAARAQSREWAALTRKSMGQVRRRPR